MRNRSKTTITITLRSTDWHEDLGGWTCSALSLPSAVLRQLVSSGQPINESSYRAQGDLRLIKWNGSEEMKKRDIVAVIDIEQTLTTKKRVIEWSSVATIVSALVTGLVTYQVALLNIPDSAHVPAMRGNVVEYRTQAEGLEDILVDYIKKSRNEIWMFGTSFRKAADYGSVSDALIEAAKRKVDVRFLVVSPSATDTIAQLADSWGLPPDMVDQIVSESKDGLSFIARLKNEAIKLGANDEAIQVRVTNDIPFNRSYYFDPRSKEGSHFFIPYSNMTVSAKTPVFVLPGNSDVSNTLFNGIEDAWNKAHAPLYR